MLGIQGLLLSEVVGNKRSVWVDCVFLDLKAFDIVPQGFIKILASADGFLGAFFSVLDSYFLKLGIIEEADV